MIKAIFAYPCGNLSANASGQGVFMKYKYAIGFLHRLFNCFFIPRKQCSQVKQISFYLFHFTENLLSPMHSHSISDDREIKADLLDLRTLLPWDKEAVEQTV